MNRKHLTYSLMMSVLMTGTVSALVTLMNIGIDGEYLHHWLQAWSLAFPVGFTVLLTASPLVKRVNEALHRCDSD